jgi:hypothetical protein
MQPRFRKIVLPFSLEPSTLSLLRNCETKPKQTTLSFIRAARQINENLDIDSNNKKLETQLKIEPADNYFKTEFATIRPSGTPLESQKEIMNFNGEIPYLCVKNVVLTFVSAVGNEKRKTLKCSRLSF